MKPKDHAALHTQGPWTQERDGSIVMAGQVVGFLAPDDATKEERQANSRLIVAAPELLEIVTILLLDHQRVAPHHSGMCETCRLALAAISAAQGGR